MVGPIQPHELQACVCATGGPGSGSRMSRSLVQRGLRSTLQGLPCEPGALGLSLQLLLLHLQLCRQLLRLRKAALQRVPLSPAEKERTAARHPGGPAHARQPVPSPKGRTVLAKARPEDQRTNRGHRIPF